MPLYEYECGCGHRYEAFNKVEERDNEVCPRCGFIPTRLLTVPGRPMVYEYFSENLNAYVTGPRQKARLLKEKNLSEVG